MFKRVITKLRKGRIIQYNGSAYEVEDVYSFIAYIRSLTTEERICVGIGDLVIAGVEPSLPLSIYDFTDKI